MIGGKQRPCDGTCRYCPPSDMEKAAREIKAVVDLLNDPCGNFEAAAISEVADAIKQAGGCHD